MEVFAYDPRVNLETLAGFNARVNEFCEQSAVISVETSVIGSCLLLSLTTADDMNAPDGTPTVQVMLKVLNTKDDNIEEQLGSYLTALYAKDTEENPCAPITVKAIARLDKPGEGWVLFTCLNGASESDGDADEPADGIPTVDGILSPE